MGLCTPILETIPIPNRRMLLWSLLLLVLRRSIAFAMCSKVAMHGLAFVLASFSTKAFMELLVLMMLLGRTMLVPPRASPASPASPVLLRLRGGCSGVKASPE